MIYELIQKVINEEHDPNFYQSYNSLNEIDKNNIEQIILQNKLSSLFLKFIYENNLISRLDKNFYRKLKAQSSRFQTHSLQIIKEVHLINKLFINAGLNPIYLKGVAIQKEYKDISLRPMVDIDILLKKEEILLAYEILHKNNFLSKKEDKFLNKSNINDFCSSYHHHIHVISKNNISIELHHRLTPLRSFKDCPITRSFFDGCRTIDYYGEKILTPSIENIIVHLLCHFSINSSFNKLLITLVDIRTINKNYEINWQEILSKYTNKKIRKSICLSLELINFNIQRTANNPNFFKNISMEYSPDNDLIKELQTKLFDVNRNQSIEIFYDNFLKSKHPHKILAQLLFPSQKIILFRYKISKPTWINLIKAYTAYYLEHIPKLFELIQSFLTTKKRNNYMRSGSLVNDWFNKS